MIRDLDRIRDAGCMAFAGERRVPTLTRALLGVLIILAVYLAAVVLGG